MINGKVLKRYETKIMRERRSTMTTVRRTRKKRYQNTAMTGEKKNTSKMESCNRIPIISRWSTHTVGVEKLQCDRARSAEFETPIGLPFGRSSNPIFRSKLPAAVGHQPNIFVGPFWIHNYSFLKIGLKQLTTDTKQ